MTVFHKLTSFILMFIFCHEQIRTAQAQEPTPFYLAYNLCSRSNYSVNSTYQTNLNLLLSSLSNTFTDNNTIPLYGYRNVTVGENPDTVYGSLHCREDIAPDICSACVRRAAGEVGKDSMCPNSKRAIMFYNGCVLRYSNNSYFSIMQEEPAVPLNNQNNVTDPASYLTLVTGLIDGLVIQAVNSTSTSPSLFSTGTANCTRENTVYGMVQCTPDITPSSCATCVRSAMKLIPEYFYGKRGARVLSPSCTFRYEIYPFYGQSVYATTRALAPAPVLSPPPTLQSLPNASNGSNSNSLRLAVSISVPLGITVLLSSIAVWWFLARILNENLLLQAWRHWQNGSAQELLDASIQENCSRSEVMRCLHIALLCVQHSIANRPTMTTVILMLNSNSVTLPIPTQPGYLVSDEAVEDQRSLNEASFTELSPR